MSTACQKALAAYLPQACRHSTARGAIASRSVSRVQDDLSYSYEYAPTATSSQRAG